LAPGPKSPSTKCRDPSAAAQSPTAAARSNCSHHAATAATDAITLAHGFSIEMMVELVNAGLASATPERVRAGNKTMEVARVRITEAGRLRGRSQRVHNPWDGE
jgi:hypothetical protein